MSDPFVAEIRAFGFNFAPRGWAQCNGQLMPISQNTALFALIGTSYGGDGRSTFALPNLQESAPVGVGRGQGLNEWFLGERRGGEAITLLQSEIPLHTHSLMASVAPATSGDPTGKVLARGNFLFQGATGAAPLYSDDPPNTRLNPQAIAPAGAGLPHNNMMPSLVVNYCIALQGFFPPRP